MQKCNFKYRIRGDEIKREIVLMKHKPNCKLQRTTSMIPYDLCGIQLFIQGILIRTMLRRRRRRCHCGARRLFEMEKSLHFSPSKVDLKSNLTFLFKLPN